MTVLHLKQSNGRSPSRLALLLIPLVFACFVLSPAVQALVPAPDGGYPGGNTAAGQKALLSLTSGGYNTAIGFLSLSSDATGSLNTALGAGALLVNTADNNTATGAAALLLNTYGSNNTAVGAVALLNNTEGYENTATGDSALYSNTTGLKNTANGYQALFSNSTGYANTANGNQALMSNTYGSYNTANGYQALTINTTGSSNTANGVLALVSNTTGSVNTANGSGALQHNTTGNSNTALGLNAGFNVDTADNVICIGAQVHGANVSNTTWIGNVYGVTTQNASNTGPVIISADGQLGTTVSSERFKKDIAPMERASETLLSLRPVTFHYKTDTTGTPQFGLIAEEVAKVNPALVLPDKEGKPYTVRYDQVNAMLLNEFLKEHREVEDLKNDFQAAVAQQQKEIAALVATVKEQASQIQKVSAQLEASKPAPQVVNNP